jgi:hypothetical protein
LVTSITHGKTDGENLPYLMGQPTSADTGDSSGIHGPTDVGSDEIAPELYSEGIGIGWHWRFQECPEIIIPELFSKGIGIGWH